MALVPGGPGAHAGAGAEAAPEPVWSDRTVLALADVVKEYPGNPPVRALDGVTFAVEAGEMVAVVGPSGSGKSTLLHLVGALDRPSSGTVRVAGADIGALSDRELSALRAWQVGFVFQQFHLLDGLPALDNVAAGLLYRGLPVDDRRDRAAAALARVGLATGRPTGPPSSRAASASAWPSPGRSSANRRSCWRTSRPATSTRSPAARCSTSSGACAAGSTIVVITHDLQVAAGMPAAWPCGTAASRATRRRPGWTSERAKRPARGRAGRPHRGGRRLGDAHLTVVAAAVVRRDRGEGVARAGS